MKVSRLLGFSGSWLVTAVVIAFDLGVNDTLFFPTLCLGIPAFVGLGVSLRALRSKPEPLERRQVVGFGVLGALVVMLSVLLLIAVTYWGEPLPGDEPMDETGQFQN